MCRPCATCRSRSVAARRSGLVGESGCGKSTVAYGLVNYLGRNGKIANGDIVFQGKSLVGRSAEELRQLRGDQISMVYQDPMTSLNPVLRVGDQMTEVLTVHRGAAARPRPRQRCVEMLRRVYMPDPEQGAWSAIRTRSRAASSSAS